MVERAERSLRCAAQSRLSQQAFRKIRALLTANPIKALTNASVTAVVKFSQ